jgi:hypothetical protein
MFRCLLWAIAAAMRPKMLLIADNLCLRQQLYYPGPHAGQIASDLRHRRALRAIGQDGVPGPRVLFNERHLEKVLAEYVSYFNHWRPHRSIGQRAPCAPGTDASHRSAQASDAARPVTGLRFLGPGRR